MPLDMTLDDAELVQLVVKGNREAFAELYDRHASRVHGLVVRILGESMAAEEVTQDTFLKLWTRAKSFSPHKGSLLAWLLTIARRTALDRVRLENRRPEFDNRFDPELTWKYTPDPKSETEEARWRSLYFSLHNLPDEQRQVIEFAYYHGMSQSQIAEYMNIPLGTVKTRTQLGMKKLRQIWITDKSKSK